jgi:predicted GH43/DUF377 family glycosyl hydrolase
VNVTKHGILLEKTKLGFENEGVLNPAAIRDGEYVHLYYRAVSKGNYSTVGYCKLKGPLTVEERMDSPIIFPQAKNEIHGVEDPRICKIDDQYYLTYTAYDGENALGALALSEDAKNFRKWGIITAQISYMEFIHLAKLRKKINPKYERMNEQVRIHEHMHDKLFLWDKNVMFFPRRIDGKLCMLHRIKPDIQVVRFDKLEDLTDQFWQNYFIHLRENIVIDCRYDHESSYVGGGAPPIETEQGWLIIYHSVRDTVKGYVYSACAALLDLETLHEIARLPYPLFQPDLDWELKGYVNNVCFPSGTVIFDNTLYIYYGAADKRVACASVDLTELLNELMLNVKHHDKEQFI